MFSSALLRFLPHIAISVAVIGAGAYLRISGYHAGERATEARMQKLVAIAEAQTEQIERAARMTSEVVDREYHAKLVELDAKYRNAVARIGPVRVRQCPSGDGQVPGVPSAPPVDHGSAGGDELSQPAGGPDIGPELVELARLADEQTQRLVACQAWITEQRN